MPARDPSPPPGTVRPARFLPRFHYELLVCGVRGHALLGTDVAELRPQDRIVAREYDGLRWYRCLRCDSWLPLQPPADPVRRHLPERSEIEVPLRGRPLRDKIVLRLIAIDRALHFVLLGLLAVAVFLVANHQHELQHRFYRVITDIQGGVAGGPVQNHKTGLVGELDRLFSLRRGTLHEIGAALALYAVLEGAEAVGLWFQQRWAEYLTLVATTLLLPLEIYELSRQISWFRVIALIVNIAIVVYLLLAKRLFGLRGGAAALAAERERDTGRRALERTVPNAPLAGEAPARA